MLRGNEQVHELQQYMEDIYRVSNTELTIESILGRMVEAIAEATSPFETSDVHSTFVKALSWYFAFCNRVSIDVQQSTILRYPQLCPLCLNEVCICERTHRWPQRANHLAGNRDEELSNRADRLLNTHKIARKKKKTNFDLIWFSNTLADIYPVNRARWKVNRFFFPAKMLRETGKLANGFRRYRNAGGSPVGSGAKILLEKDAADFFAWLVGYWTLAAHETQDVDLQSKFVSHYAVGCPYCNQLPCACPREKRLGNRAEFVAFNLSTISPDLAAELDKRLSELRDTLESCPTLAREFEADWEDAKLGTSKKGAINTLQKISSKAKELDDIAGTGENIIKRASAMAEWIDRLFG